MSKMVRPRPKSRDSARLPSPGSLVVWHAPGQLDDGIRLFKISTHYAIADSGGGVHTDIAAEGARLNRVASKLAPDARAALQRLSRSLGRGSLRKSKRDIWLCHMLCELGATRMVSFLAVIRRFIERNPDQVVILFDEDYVSERILRPMEDARWATFDCYGTLVGWNAGIGAELARLFGRSEAERLLGRYHEIEPRVQSEHQTWSYRRVMAEVLAALASGESVVLPSEEEDALGRSLPGWPVFEEVPAALAEARARGWKLVALTNRDRDLIEASMRAIGVPFESPVVASEIGSYKPAPGHWRAFFQSSGADPERHVHVAQSHFHDIVPTNELGLRSVWINRLDQRGEPAPTRQLPDLRGLADVLDQLVPLRP